ncbi:MAG: GHKL domain-containing protein [Romboutsia sp.]|nr:GHKL domain-containing protein [Romboutsia sp.]
MDTLDIIKHIVNIISVIMVIYFFNKVFESKYNNKCNKICTIFIIILYSIISLMGFSNITTDIIEKPLITLIFKHYTLLLIYPIFFKKGRISEKLILSSIYVTISLASSIIAYSIVIVLLSTGISVEIANKKAAVSLLTINNIKILIMVVTRCVQFIIICLVVRNTNFIKYIKDRTLYLAYIILILSQMLLYALEKSMVTQIQSVNLYTLIYTFSLSIIEMLLIYVLLIFSNEMKEKFTLKMNLERNIYDKRIINMYKQMLGWRHDFRNHINVILGKLQYKDKEDAISYIYEMSSDIYRLEQNIYTDNVVINSILLSKKKESEEHNIKISLDLNMDYDIKVSDIDMCIILGNLLDNSIEACSNIEGDRFIDLKIVSQTNRLIIKISNNTNGNLNEVDGKFFTTKKSGIHGLGLIQIDEIVKKYNGYINRKHESNIFTTYINIEY